MFHKICILGQGLEPVNKFQEILCHYIYKMYYLVWNLIKICKGSQAQGGRGGSGSTEEVRGKQSGKSSILLIWSGVKRLLCHVRLTNVSMIVRKWKSLFRCLGSESESRFVGFSRFWLPGSRSAEICGSTDPDLRGKISTKNCTKKLLPNPKSELWTMNY